MISVILNSKENKFIINNIQVKRKVKKYKQKNNNYNNNNNQYKLQEIQQKIIENYVVFKKYNK